MLIPRFTLRWLLLLTTVCGGLSLVLSYAIQGREWAIAVSLALGAIPLLFLLHALAFAVAWGFAQISNGISGMAYKPKGASPFASAGPPRQIVPPVEPE